MNSQLYQLGWDDFFQGEFDQINPGSWAPVRVVRENRGQYIITDGVTKSPAQLAGSFRMHSHDSNQIPTVGDWVCVQGELSGDLVIIHALIPRRTLIERQVAGDESRSQLMAANIDTLFLVSGLDAEFNLNRIQRYLTLAGNSGAQPVIILNKSDLCQDLPGALQSIEAIAPNVAVHTISAISETSMECILPYVEPGQTVAMLGSSGVGKSTLANALLGEARLLTQSNRDADGKGRHTTTWRELIPLPRGGNLIDLPGMRELQLTGDEEGLKQVFEDIELLAEQCRFRNCRHEGEPGCAIDAAIEEGELDGARYEQYLKMKRETEFAKAREAERARKAGSLNQARVQKDRKFKRIHQNLRKNRKAEEKWGRENDRY